MKLSCTLDFSSVVDKLYELEYRLQDKLLVEAVDAGGDVLLKGYQSKISEHVKGRVRTGTFSSASGTIEHFQHMIDSVGKTSRLFKDKTGAYCIVGIVSAPGTRKPVAPQAGWFEEGADGSSQGFDVRRHKDGSSTGVEEATPILQETVAELCTQAQDTALSVLVEGICRVLAK